MKQLPLTLLFAFFACSANAQIREDLVALLYQHKYETLIVKGHEYLANDANDASACEIMGAAFFETNRNDSAVYYLNRSLDIDRGKTLTSCWDHIYLGKYYHLIGDYEKAKTELEKSINKNATKKMKVYSSKLLFVFGFDDYYKNWYVAETEHIIFHFQDTSLFENFRTHMAAHETIYKQADSLFHAIPKKKLDVYYWKNKDLAKEILGTELPVNNLHQYLAHASAPDSLAHIIMYSVLNARATSSAGSRNQLIYFGIRAAFDKTVCDKYILAKKAVENIYVGDIKKVWENPSVYSKHVLHPLGEALVFYLKTKSSHEQFTQLIEKQDIENARLIYGERFNALMSEFNTEILSLK